MLGRSRTTQTNRPIVARSQISDDHGIGPTVFLLHGAGGDSDLPELACVPVRTGDVRLPMICWKYFQMAFWFTSELPYSVYQSKSSKGISISKLMLSASSHVLRGLRRFRMGRLHHAWGHSAGHASWHSAGASWGTSFLRAF
jgi:hypothetical protein